jgi:poly(ADP-ribose) glycohydrolase ARH3
MILRAKKSPAQATRNLAHTVTSIARDRCDAALGALLGTFVGDALGMPFEGQPSTLIPAQPEMVEARLGRGTYTDDTEMMIVLAESLEEYGSVKEEQLARAFLEGCDVSRGYGAGTLEVFALWRRGVSVAEAAGRLFGGDGSLGNGAAMRIAPVAVRFAESPELRTQAERSARLTHAHPLAVDAALVQATAIAAALRGDDILHAAHAAARTAVMREQLARASELLTRDVEPAEAAAALGNSSAGQESVPTAIFGAVSKLDFEQAVCFAVRCGGDTDTLGAMAGAIAGARGGASSIPSRWLNTLEDGKRGRSHVEELGRVLARPEE